MQEPANKVLWKFIKSACENPEHEMAKRLIEASGMLLPTDSLTLVVFEEVEF